MKIAMILSAPLPPREGIGFYTWNLARHLKNQGHFVQLITRGRVAPLNKFYMDGIPVWEVPFFPFYPFHVHFHSLFIQSLIRKIEADLDILHLHSPLVLPPKTELPMLVTVHTPMKADVNAIEMNNLYGLMIKYQLPFSVLIEKILFSRADKLAAVASSVAHELSEYNIEPDTVLVAGNAVDTNIFKPAENQKDHQNGYFLSAGRLGPRKGFEDLIEAVLLLNNNYPYIKFIILGDGPLYKELNKRIKKAGLEKSVILAGHVSDRAQLVDYYQSSLGFIHPAHYEGLPTVLLEAMACGKAVIATSVSGALDVIKHGVNGILVETRTPKELAQAISYLLQHPQKVNQLGRAAYETVREKYSWEIITKKYEDLYRQILSEHKSK